tara:strand:+ start:336 stop:503 length:168 start_codon:yes stop_codon:yes gene_type:complete
MKPVEDRDLSDEEIKDWLYNASVGKLNIFHDRNEIIILLCREVLRTRKEKERGDV